MRQKNIMEDEKNKSDDNFMGITLSVDIVNMGIQSKGWQDGSRLFTTGIYFKHDYVFYSNGHFLVYRKIKDIADIKELDGQLWNFEKHKKPKVNDIHLFYKIYKINETELKAVSDYGTVKIIRGVSYPNIECLLPDIDEKRYIGCGLNPYYLKTITCMLGRDSVGEVAIHKRNITDAMILTSNNGGAILMPIKVDILKQVEKHIKFKRDIKRIFKKKAKGRKGCRK